MSQPPRSEENVMNPNTKDPRHVVSKIRVPRVIIAGLVVALVTACAGDKKAVPCTEDSNCDLTTGGACVAAESGAMWCAYPDGSCSSGLRYSDQGVGDDLGGTCTAGTAPVMHTLTVNLGGSGTGSVSSSPSGLTCAGNACTGQFPDGTMVQLTAVPTTGQLLAWGQSCTGAAGCSVTMDMDHQVTALFGVPGSTIWAAQLGNMGRDFGQGIAVDASNDVIAVGEFTRTVMVGSTALVSAGSSDIYVVKYDAATGNVIWAKRFGGAANDVALDVAVDAARNIYVTGHFDGAVDFGGGVLNGSGGQGDIFALALTPDGDFVWARQFGGPSYETGEGIAVRDGAVVVAGLSDGAVTVDSTTLPFSGTYDLFVASVSAATGTTNWAKSFGGSGGTEAFDVAIDSNDTVVIAGAFYGTTDFGGGAISTPGGLADVLLLKLGSSTGAHQLSTHYGSSVNDYGYGVAIDATNDIYVTGNFNGTASFGCGNQLTASQANLSDAFLVKFTQAGACLWDKGFGGSGTTNRDAWDVTVGAAGVAFTGDFCGTITFGGPTFTAAGSCPSQDVFTALFAADGTYLDSTRAGGVANDIGQAIAQGSDGRLYVTGAFTSLAEFGGTAFTSAGDYDAFVFGLEAQ